LKVVVSRSLEFFCNTKVSSSLTQSFREIIKESRRLPQTYFERDFKFRVVTDFEKQRYFVEGSTFSQFLAISDESVRYLTSTEERVERNIWDRRTRKKKVANNDKKKLFKVARRVLRCGELN